VIDVPDAGQPASLLRRRMPSFYYHLLPQVVINEEPCGMRDAPQNCDLFLEVKEQVRAGVTVL
jgi:hypothetical protein